MHVFCLNVRMPLWHGPVLDGGFHGPVLDGGFHGPVLDGGFLTVCEQTVVDGRLLTCITLTPFLSLDLLFCLKVAVASWGHSLVVIDSFMLVRKLLLMAIQHFIPCLTSSHLTHVHCVCVLF